MAVLAPSLVRLRAEIDRRWPHRDRRTDGWYRPYGQGPYSDHWPDDKGMVHALDIDSDGILPDWLAVSVARPRGVLSYIIWNRRIASARYAWVWRPYYGTNPHTNHLHFSIYHTYVAENYSRGWAVSAAGQGTIGPAAPSVAGLEGVDPYPYIDAAGHWVKVSGDQTYGWARNIANLRH